MIRKDATITKKDDIQMFMKHVVSFVCDYYSVPVDDALVSNRVRQYADVRKIICYIAKKFGPPGISLQTIGDNIGGRDHSTVLYSVKQIERILSVDKHFAKHVKDIVEKFQRTNYAKPSSSNM